MTVLVTMMDSVKTILNTQMEIGTVVSGTNAGTVLQFQARDFAGGKLTNLQQGVVS